MKVAVIGGTSGTLGKEIAALLIKEGHTVVSASRHSSPEIDIQNWESVQHFFQQEGPFDGVICAAGYAAFKSVEDASSHEWASSFNSKLMGQINLVRYGIKHTSEGAHFVLTGGMLAFKSAANTAPVSTVNAALDGFVRAASADLKGEKHLAIVHPPMVAETAQSMDKRVGEDHSDYPQAHKVARVYLKALTSKQTGNAFFLEEYTPRLEEHQEPVSN